ncbi:uncharacterized protein LOC119071007 [Bradysia coprophila]|uniref:uncharacterized protein LOC119071007 n=1 Tax=Bradysia coprophila TaxID=38358 RepID=UPI00187DB494|nr:uncharacterized protein LOC119071007 [Bradysia coprophila]
MKFITVCVTVCAIALNLSLMFANPQTPPTNIVNTSRTDESGQSFFTGDLQKILRHQFDTLVHRINETWLQCNETYAVSGFKNRVDLFSNAPTNEVDPIVNNTRRCLVDCTLRKMGVMTDDGLNKTAYMAQIKQLRFNYTSFDITKKPIRTQQKIYEVINAQVPYLIAKDYCYGTGPWLEVKDLHHMCNQLIYSYEMAAYECRDIIDPTGDNCETSWMIMGCMIESHRRRSFESPFYPIYPDTVKRSL